MVKIKEVEVTKPELDALEHLATVWILCEKHNAKMDWKDEVKVFRIQNTCKDCQKEVRKASKRALHLWSKLFHYYNISRYGKCCDEKM